MTELAENGGQGQSDLKASKRISADLKASGAAVGEVVLLMEWERRLNSKSNVHFEGTTT